MKFTTLQVPAQGLAGFGRLDSDKMHEHFLHQVLLKIGIGSQLLRDPM
jgi:hypothetical protein